MNEKKKIKSNKLRVISWFLIIKKNKYKNNKFQFNVIKKVLYFLQNHELFQ